MNRFIESLNAFSVDWSPWLWRACWQVAIVVAVAWLLSIALRRSSPWLRSWIWRLAYVKILLVLVWTTPVSLPLLPPSNQPPLAATATSLPPPTDTTTVVPAIDEPANPVNVEPPTTPLVANNADTDPPASAPFNVTAEAPIAAPSAYAAADSSRPITNEAATPEPIAASAKLSLTSWLFLIWIAGAIAVVSWFALETRRAFALYRSARRIENMSLAALVATVCKQLGLKRSVQLAESDLVGGPMLVKFLRPLIVFPSGMLSRTSSLGAKGSTITNPISPSPSTGECRGEGEAAPSATIKQTDSEQSILTSDEIRLVLAHELAHLKRHDLSWNFLSALVHAVLYFHPFVWFAHRSARQEQEMACDELVVTRLGVERHEYGQLLVKIVRQVGRQMNGAVATVGMSKSYQTLSRRIGAMGQFRKLTRREMSAAAVCLAISAGLALVPWRLVAQDSKPARFGPILLRPVQARDASAGSKVEPLSDEAAEEAYRRSRVPWPRMQAPDAAGETVAAVNDPAAPQAAEDPDDAARRKLIVGTSRDQWGNKISFFDDGTYDDFGVNIFLFAVRNGSQNEYGRKRGQGTWEIHHGFLSITSDRSQRYWLGEAKADAVDRKRAEHCQYEIRRLDDFLRLACIVPTDKEKLFLRRVDEKSADEQYPTVEADLRPIFLAAQLTPEEVTAFEQVNKEQGNYFSEYLQLIAKVQEVQRRKRTLQQLFDMTPEEVKAFQNLLEQVGGQDSLEALAKGDQLAPDERSAFTKTQKVSEAFRRLAKRAPNRWDQRNIVSEYQLKSNDFLKLETPEHFSERGGAGWFSGEQLSAFAKLYTYLWDLDLWYRSAVFSPVKPD